MKTKTIFLWVLLAMLVGGVNSAWAETHTYVLWNNTYVSSSNPETNHYIYSFDSGLTISNTNDKGYGQQNGYIKFSNGTQYSVTGIPNREKITSVQFIGYTNGKYTVWSSENDLYISEFDGTNYSIDNPSGNNFNTAYHSEDEATLGSVTFSGLSILSGGFTFTPQGNQLDFKITITTEDIPTYTYDISVEDLCYEHRYYASDLDRDVAGFSIAASSGVQSYNNSGTYKLLVDNYSTLTIGPNSSNSSIKILQIQIGLDDGTYIYVDNDAPGSVACTNTSGSQKGVTSFRIITNGETVSSPITPTLTFSPTSARYEAGAAEQNLGDLNTGTLQTNPKAFRLTYSITSNGTGTSVMPHYGDKYLGITPGTTTGTETLTASFAGNSYFNSASATFGIIIGGGTFTGEYTVTRTETVDGSVRNMEGKYTFTGAGTISGGTIIDDVPGITMTVGATGDNGWSVSNNYTGSNYSAGPYATNATTVDRWSFTQGSFYKFVPYVNGFLTIEGKSLSNHTFLYLDNSNQNDIGFFNNYDNGVLVNGSPYTFTFPLIAGNTYYLCAMSAEMQLHSFSFRPAFLEVDPSTGALTNTETTNITSGSPWSANLSTPADRFPHLITSAAGQGLVKFAGDKTIVNLSTNNDVTLLGNGTTIIKGTVLQEGSDNTLFAYYYLRSTILQLATTNPTTLNDASIVDNAYVDNSGTESNPYVFTFNQDIVKTDAYQVLVSIDGGNEVSFSGNDWTTVPTIDGETSSAQLSVQFNALTDGSSYRIRIPAGSIRSKADTDVKNAEIVRTFTINKSKEAPLSLVYPTGVATVSTSIVLETSAQKLVSGNWVLTPLEDKDGGVVSINDKQKVTGILKKADGTGGEMPIVATYSSNRLIFKPTAALETNTNYMLQVNAVQVYMNEADYTDDSKDNKEVYTVTKNKAFYFTTGAAAGTVPRVKSTNPVEGSTVEDRNTYITFTFDQNIDLEQYSTIDATPINGGEATRSGVSLDNDVEKASVTLRKYGTDAIQFECSGDQLKYDIWYEVILPANTVSGVGGKPNDSFTLKFKVGKKSGITDVEDKFYPHTWDFNRMGQGANSSASYIKAVDGSGTNSLQASWDTNGTTRFRKYTSKANSTAFDQGNEIYVKTSEGDKDLPEFDGMRVSLKNANVQRFELRNIAETEVKEGETWKRLYSEGDAAAYNPDGSEKFVFRMNGNTHYFTLSNVPVGKLYMVVNSPHLGINSPNATFANVAGATIENKGTLLNTNGGTRKVVINVAQKGDVSFCVKNFSCEKIGVAKDEKTFRPDFAESGKTYATDRITYDVRYDLLNAFTDHDVKAYYVSNWANKEDDYTATFTATEVSNKVAKANQGVIVLYQGAVGSNTTVPIFKTDVNSAAADVNETGSEGKLPNKLKVIGQKTTALPSVADGTYMYVLSNRGTKSTGIGFYRYTGSVFSDRAAYLEVPKSWVEPAGGGSEARAIRLVFQDEEDGETTAIQKTEAAGVSETNDMNGIIYDLRGLRVAKPSKGLYIINGKKVYVK